MFEIVHRLQDTSVATKARLEKFGQHKLGSGGYMNLQSRLVTREMKFHFFLNIILQTILFNGTIHGKLMILRKKYRAHNSMWRSQMKIEKLP